MSEIRLLCGDALEQLRLLPESSVDAVVTDPPYGLSFMGKDWDHGIPGEPFWREALRVSRPGAHLLAFGGTRTFHRLTCAIEDAGWEIRDCLMYVYGSGFPKSKNVGCRCGGQNGTEQKAERGMRSLRDTDVSSPISDQTAAGQILLALLPQQGVPENRAKARNGNEGTVEPGLEGRGDVLSETRELQTDQVCPLPGRIPSDGPQGRLCDGAPTASGNDTRASAIEVGGRPPQKPQPTGQFTGEPGIVRVESGAQDSGVCPGCGGLVDWVGFGTALKPAWEPIILARKPLDGTVAENVQKWGTGALNIDGCRVEGTPGSGVWGSSNKTCQDGRTFNASPDGEEYRSAEHPSGRWPANLIHDGSEEVVGMFPDVGKSAGGRIGNAGGGTVTNVPTGRFEKGDPGFGDSGSAARFFYCAKASKEDRGEGNKHPTVKPTDLMRYLCRLVTPPGGTVLDPFMGSGSTGKAALLDGFSFIGIDNVPEYVEMARRRIEGTAPLFAGEAAARAAEGCEDE